MIVDNAPIDNALRETQMKAASWVIVRKADGKAIFETFNEKTIQGMNAERYEAVPILTYLQNLNAFIKRAA